MTRRKAIRAGQRYREWLGIVAEMMQAAGMTQDDLAIRSQIALFQRAEESKHSVYCCDFIGGWAGCGTGAAVDAGTTAKAP